MYENSTVGLHNLKHPSWLNSLEQTTHTSFIFNWKFVRMFFAFVCLFWGFVCLFFK